MHLRTYLFFSRIFLNLNLKLGMRSKIDMKLDGNHCDPSIFMAPFFALSILEVSGQMWVGVLLRGVLMQIFRYQVGCYLKNWKMKTYTFGEVGGWGVLKRLPIWSILYDLNRIWYLRTYNAHLYICMVGCLSVFLNP